MSDYLPQGIPDGVQVDSLDLSADECRSYPRWYTDLLLRKGRQSVAIGDALSFVDNFGLRESDKQSILAVFQRDIATLDPAQFYIFLRLAGHILEGKNELEPEMIYIQAGVPKPRSILSRKRKNETIHDEEETKTSKAQGVGNPFRKVTPSPKPPKQSGKMDIDSFATFLLTGNRPSGSASSGTSSDDDTPSESSKKKRVTFDSEPQVAQAAGRSMEELMRQHKIQAQVPQIQHPPPLPPHPPISQHNVQDEEEEEDDVEITNNVFANVKVDSVLHHGVSVAAPEPDSNRMYNGDGPSKSLTQFASAFDPRSASPSPPLNDTLEFAKRFIPSQATGLAPQTTGNQTHNPGSLHPQSAATGATYMFSGRSLSAVESSGRRNTPSPDPQSIPSAAAFMPPAANTNGWGQLPPPPPARRRVSSMEQSPSPVNPNGSLTNVVNSPASIFFPGGQYPGGPADGSNNSSTSSITSFPSLPVHSTNQSNQPSPLSGQSGMGPSPSYSLSPTLHHQQQTGSGLPFIAPPPPVPRRSISSNYRPVLSPQPTQVPQVQVQQPSQPPQPPPRGGPPPPPPRRRAPSLPGNNQGNPSVYLQPSQPSYGLNTSSAPDLIGDISRLNIRR